MNTTRLGPPLHEERGYAVREVFDARSDEGLSEGFTFEGPGFNALIIYPNFNEALLALQSLADACLPGPQSDPVGAGEPVHGSRNPPPDPR
jgi:hypothetical protein